MPMPALEVPRAAPTAYRIRVNKILLQSSELRTAKHHLCVINSTVSTQLYTVILVHEPQLPRLLARRMEQKVDKVTLSGFCGDGKS